MSEFRVGDWVVPHPRHTLRFNHKIGQIIQIAQSDDALKFKVAFHKGAQLYGFSYEELLTKEEFIEMVNKPTYCYYCGKDITGEFSFLCDICEYPIFDSN